MTPHPLNLQCSMWVVLVVYRHAERRWCTHGQAECCHGGLGQDWPEEQTQAADWAHQELMSLRRFENSLLTSPRALHGPV